MKLNNVLTLSALVMISLAPCAAFADDKPANAGSAPATAGSAAPAQAAPASGQPMQAGVQIIELNLERLRDLGLDIKNIMKAASSLYDEVTIQPVSVMTQPEVIGRGIIVNIPIGTMPTGAGPQPKKKRVDMAMNQMRPIIQLLKTDCDEFEDGRRRLDISDDEQQELKPFFDEWVRLVNSMSSDLDTLEKLTNVKNYDNGAIANAAGDIQKDSKKMDEVRRKVYKQLQKDGKKKKNKNA